ncbi:MAG: peptidylprolyl isomerase [Rhodospirillaceae bacterium]
MLKRLYLFAALVLGCLVMAAPGGVAQDALRIAAVVNDEVVSIYDLESRLRFVIATSGVPDTMEARRRLAPEVLRGLIDERLQLQEAKKRNIAVSDKEIEEAIRNVERQNGMPAGGLEQFLLARGLQQDTMEQQIRAAIAWGKLISQLYRSRLSVGNDEIEEMLERFKERQGQTEYRLSEIVLTVDTPQREQATADAAQRLVAEIRNGARFDVMARQFSQSATAATGGDLGWVVAPDLGDQLRAVVDKLQPDEIAGPFRTQVGYQIVKLTARRAPGQSPVVARAPAPPPRASAPPPAATPASAPARATPAAGGGMRAAKLRLRQVFFAPGGPQSALERARAASGQIKDCRDMERAARDARSPMPVDLGLMQVGDLAVPVRNAVANLPIGKASAPVAVGDGAIVLMVCGREGGEPAPAQAAAAPPPPAPEPAPPPPPPRAEGDEEDAASAATPGRMPTREEVSSLLMRQRLDLAARRHMRDLRLAAVIDTRL